MTAAKYASLPQQNSKRIKDWAKSYKIEANENAYWIEKIEGEVPQEIEGTLFRNGIGSLKVGKSQVGHIFDGDGMIGSFSFKEGKVYFQNRFVKTEGYLKEQKTQKILYRGFGTQKPGGWLKNIFDLNFKNVSNTSTVYWADRLLTMWEGGQPYRINPQNLETIGEGIGDGLLEEKGQPFSAHPKIIDDTLINFGVSGNSPQTLTIWEFNQEGSKIQQHSHPLKGFAILHDMLVTPNYYIFIQHPFKVNGLPFVLGFKTIEECLEFDKEGKTRIIVISRNEDYQMQELETEAFFGFHHGNAWEENNKIILETTFDERFPQKKRQELNLETTKIEELPFSTLVEFTIDLKDKTLIKKEIISDRGCDMLIFHPLLTGKKHRYLYSNTSRLPHQKGPLQGILKLDKETGKVQIWQDGDRAFPGEPILVPKPDSKTEDDSWLMSVVYDASIENNYLLILDARDLKYEVARVYLKHPIPQSFHGFWSDKYFI